MGESDKKCNIVINGLISKACLMSGIKCDQIAGASWRTQLLMLHTEIGRIAPTEKS